MHQARRELPTEQSVSFSTALRADPRVEMAARLPRAVQPLLTWITAKPAPGENAVARLPTAYIKQAIALVVGGCLASGLAVTVDVLPWAVAAVMLAAGLLATSSGLGLFQVVIFHHCSHGTVFRHRERNEFVGRLVSALLLFKHFDHYRKEHMVHHNANKLFTDDDEFTDFVVGICDLAPASTRAQLWRRLLTDLVSPWFHGRFLYKRVRGSLFSHDRRHNLIGLGFWVGLLLIGLATDTLLPIAVAWVLPVTVLLQVATVFRILCEHRFPPMEVIQRRGKDLVCQATAGVFPGAMPPFLRATTPRGALAWIGWWANMLTVQVFVRVFVLVGDAPCHDFHHRRPANKRWTDYAHARQDDLDAGCPGFPINYVDVWGLFRAVDENFAAMAKVPADVTSL